MRDKRDNKSMKDLEKEFMEIFSSLMEDNDNNNKDKLRESMNELFQKILIESIKNANIDKTKDNKKESELKESVIIGNKKFIKFIEISEEGKRPIIYIDKSKIVAIEYNDLVAIKMDIPEYSIYKVEGSLEEVLEKLEDRIIKAESDW